MRCNDLSGFSLSKRAIPSNSPATEFQRWLARKNSVPRIVVTEILVPRLDGLSLCRALKSDPKTRSILVLVFSHLHAEDRAKEAGADAFMIKPIDEEYLIDIVSRLLELSGEGAAGQS